jgi:hypothetical protein
VEWDREEEEETTNDEWPCCEDIFVVASSVLTLLGAEETTNPVLAATVLTDGRLTKKIASSPRRVHFFLSHGGTVRSYTG